MTATEINNAHNFGADYVKLFPCTPVQCMGFFTGVILHGEISRIIKLPQKRVVTAGKRELKYSIAYLLEYFSQK